MSNQEVHQKRGGGASKKLFVALFGALLMAMAAAPAAMAVPQAPFNITVFPERDMVEVAGFAAGSRVDINVFYPGSNTPYASAKNVLVENDEDGIGVAEVNHPGGACWGGSFTPDIRPGQRVQVVGGGAPQAQDTRVLNVTATKATPLGTNQMVVTGTKAAAIPINRVEQRMIEPALDDTDVGRRDVRAPDRPGPYTSNIRVTNAAGTQWQATYTFDTPATRDVAVGGQTRVLAWEATVADERQGLTIYEEDEINGPGMGGCPPAQDVAAPDTPPTIGNATSPSAGSARVSWTAAPVAPGDGPIVGYRVTARNSTNGSSSSIDVGATRTSATISSLTSGDTYQLRVAARYTSEAGTTKTGPASAFSNTVTVR